MAQGLHLGVLVLEILLEIKWQIGDFREDGNARVTEDSNNMGDLLQDRYRARMFIDHRYRDWILRKGKFRFSIVNV